MTDPPEIHMIPVDAITVLNPRSRNKRVFSELVTSIAHLGLKKPITVSRHRGEPGYDLVCGQGRLEAFITLGETEIPAIVIEASEEDCYVMSLVENLARRNPRSLELMREIGALKTAATATPRSPPRSTSPRITSPPSAICWSTARTASWPQSRFFSVMPLRPLPRTREMFSSSLRMSCPIASSCTCSARWWSFAIA